MFEAKNLPSGTFLREAPQNAPSTKMKKTKKRTATITGRRLSLTIAIVRIVVVTIKTPLKESRGEVSTIHALRKYSGS